MVVPANCEGEVIGREWCVVHETESTRMARLRLLLQCSAQQQSRDCVREPKLRAWMDCRYSETTAAAAPRRTTEPEPGRGNPRYGGRGPGSNRSHSSCRCLRRRWLRRRSG